MEKITEQIQHMGDLKAALALIGAGAGGSFAQAVTEWSNLFVTVGNAFLVLGGVYLMYHKIYRVWKSKR